MKHNNLEPNAHITKEWEGYMKSWTIKKKPKTKKQKSKGLPLTKTPSKNFDYQIAFSTQEIKIAAQKHALTFVPYLNNDKL